MSVTMFGISGKLWRRRDEALWERRSGGGAKVGRSEFIINTSPLFRYLAFTIYKDFFAYSLLRKPTNPSKIVH
jgi:hypothetical protein